MNNFAQERDEERRLRILMAINADEDGAMSEGRIKNQLSAWAWKAPIELVRQDLRYLQRLGAIRIVDAADEMVGVLGQLARQHLAREATIEGVQPARHEF